MLKLFLQFEIEKIGRFFKNKRSAKLITSGLFGVVFLLVAVGIYSFFVSGFRYINISVEEELRLPLTLFMYEMFLLVLAGVVVLSALITGIFSLFRGQNDGWLLSTPGYKIFPRVIFVKSLVTSSWPLFIMFVPAIVAFNKVYGLTLFSFASISISVLLFLTIINATTLSSIVLLGTLYHKISASVRNGVSSFVGYIGFLSLLVVAQLIALWKIIADIDLVQLFRAENVDAAASADLISSHFTFLPTHPFAMQILNLQNNLRTEAVYNMLTLFLIAAFFTGLWWKVSHLFYPLWQKFQEGSSRSTVSTFGSSLFSYTFTGSKSLALFKKEALVSSRNMKGMLWFFFLLAIWAAQVAGNLILGHNIQKYQTDMTEKKAVLESLQFIIALYFICSFTLRFVFSSFSTEKKTAWILKSSPLNFRNVFFGKYLFYTTFFVVLGTCMNYVTASILNLSPGNTALVFSLFALSVVAIVTFGLMLGALFPNTESDDPAVISTSMSGLFFTAISLTYGALSSWLLYGYFVSGVVAPVVLFGLVSIVLIIAMLGYMLRYTMRKNVY